jgi:hypothetical protein
MVIYGVDITGSLFVSGSSNFKGDINVSGSQIVSGSLNVLNSLLLNGQPFVGTQGSQGIQGSIGVQGTNGSNGAQGNQGPTGIQGTNGTVGTQGNQGPTGLQGDTGSQGNQGPTGLQGTNGTVGTQGNQGPTGLQGDTGSQGNQGPTGIQGTNGTVGTQGNQGLTGLQGSIGAQGSTGTSAGITSYTNPADNRVLTSVNSTTINAESNLIFDGTNLGIGTLSPSTLLHLFKGSTFSPTGIFGQNVSQNHVILQGGEPQLVFSADMTSTGEQSGTEVMSAGLGFNYIGSSDFTAFRIGTDSPHDVQFRTSNTERLRITSTGNVGIGTSTIESSANYTSVNINGTSGSEMYFKANNTSVGFLYANSGSFNMGSITNVSFDILTNSTTKMRITSTGNVGIGTTSPTRRLHIVSSDDTRGIMVEQTSASSYAEVHFKANREYRIGTGGSTSAAEAANNWYVYDATAELQRFVITSAGNVGIGTSSPTSNLSFDGSAARTVGMERVTVSNTAGNNLTISASSATVGATDKNGGDVIISGGVATGTGSSRVVFRTATANFSTGTGDRTPSDKVVITGSGTIVQNGVASTFITGTCLANQTVNLGYTTVSGGRLRVHAIITPTDGTSIGAQKMSVIGNSTGGISEVVISNTTTATIGSWTFSGSGTFFGVTKNAGSASTACTYLIEIIGNLA